MTVLWFFYFIAMSLIAYILYAGSRGNGASASERFCFSAFWAAHRARWLR